MKTAELESLSARLDFAEQMQKRRYERPDEWYIPTTPGARRADGSVCSEWANQLAFHLSKHPIRCLSPGNGWGKTAAIAAEANAWATHSNRWQRTPAWPVQMLWVPKDKPQFEKMRTQLEHDSFSRPWRWRDSDDCYEWPGGDRMYVFSGEKSWTSAAGLNPDIVFCDEEPPRDLWHELMFRRRGRKDTKFCIAATAVEGITWLYDDVYKPWLEYHALNGMDEERAMRAQLHPDIFMWCKGGIDDNPSVTQEQRRWYYEVATASSSENEKYVRLHGGFRSWVGDPVFDEQAMDALERMAAEAEKKWGKGRTGSLAAVEKKAA